MRSKLSRLLLVVLMTLHCRMVCLSFSYKKKEAEMIHCNAMTGNYSSTIKDSEAGRKLLPISLLQFYTSVQEFITASANAGWMRIIRGS